MHAIEKILARAAGKEKVATGEIVNCKVDLAGINDLYLQTIRSFHEIGGNRVHDPKRLIVFLDHYAPASSINQAENQKQFREFCWDQGIDLLMDIDQGVCHQVLVDKGLTSPGQLLVVTDSHTTTHGARGMPTSKWKNWTLRPASPVCCCATTLRFPPGTWCFTVRCWTTSVTSMIFVMPTT